MEQVETTRAKHFLCVDWGANRCGLAVADSETKIATGIGDVETGQLIKRTKALNEEFNFFCVIVGRASHGSFQGNRKIEALKKELEEIGLKVETEEEFFSTKQAQKNLMQTGEKRISKNDNVESARIILQSWLDK